MSDYIDKGEKLEGVSVPTSFGVNDEGLNILIKQLVEIQIKKNILEALKDYKNRIQVTLVPNITNICYGRGVGYKIEEIVLDEKTQQISATKIREQMRKEGKLK